MYACVPALPDPIPLLPPSLPDALLTELRRQLSAEAIAEASEAEAIPPDLLGGVAEYWRHGFDFEAQRQRLLGLGLATRGAFAFAHLRAQAASAPALLVLPGDAGPWAELLELGPALTRAGAGAGHGFHVVAPAFMGRSETPAALAVACARLMRALGYERFAVHASGQAVAVARALAVRHGESVSGLHLTAVGAPSAAELRALSPLTREERSQLALLTQARHRADSPVELLAFALVQLADSWDSPRFDGLLDPLLLGLTLRWLGLGAESSAAAGAPEPTTVSTPLSLCAFPLGAPSLRRSAERKFRVLEWTLHDEGGELPALEQPQLLAGSLQRFAASSSAREACA